MHSDIEEDYGSNEVWHSVQRAGQGRGRGSGVRDMAIGGGSSRGEKRKEGGGEVGEGG